MKNYNNPDTNIFHWRKYYVLTIMYYYYYLGLFIYFTLQ